MASKTSDPDRETWAGTRTDFADFAARLARRRAALGDVDMPRNAGKRRTPSKRAMLAMLADKGADW